MTKWIFTALVGMTLFFSTASGLESSSADASERISHTAAADVVAFDSLSDAVRQTRESLSGWIEHVTMSADRLKFAEAGVPGGLLFPHVQSDVLWGGDEHPTRAPAVLRRGIQTLSNDIALAESNPWILFPAALLALGLIVGRRMVS